MSKIGKKLLFSAILAASATPVGTLPDDRHLTRKPSNISFKVALTMTGATISFFV